MKHLSVIETAALLLLASCTMTGLVDNKSDAGEREVKFSVYQEQSVQTKVSDASVKVGDTMRIGMFAFYHKNGTSFGSSGNISPDFMYNQKVESVKGGPWKYSPVKYWPNTPGATLSFFAYAPYIVGKSWESMGISVNETGKYMDVTFPVYNEPDDQKDWLWAEPKLNVGAVAAEGAYSLNDTLDFVFRHAMSKVWFVWGVNDNNRMDTEDHPNRFTDWIDKNTELSVNYIKVEGAYKSMTMRYNLEDGGDPETIGNGRQVFLLTQKHFTVDSTINISTRNIPNYKTLSTKLYLTPQDLVTNPIKVTVSITVRTTDSENPANNSVVENVITKNLADFWALKPENGKAVKDVTLASLEPNKFYIVYFLVGMNDVQIEASEVNWANGNNYWVTYLPENL